MKEKKGFEPEKRGCFVVLLFFSLVFCFIYSSSQYGEKKNLLDSEGIYFVAKVIGFTKEGKQHYIKLEYDFNSENILRKIRKNEHSAKIGKLYYIKILPNNPRGAMILFSGTEVPDYIQTNIPQEGWKEPPSYIKNAHLYEVSD